MLPELVQGQSRGWSKGLFTLPSLWPKHKRGLQIILMWNQIISLSRASEKSDGDASRCLSSAVNAALWFSSLGLMRAKQLLVNELASLLWPLTLLCTPEPTRSLAGGIWGERKVWPIALAWSHRKRSLSPPGSATPPLPPFSLWYKQRKSVKEKKPLSQDSSHSADSIIQRYPLQQHVFLRSQVHTEEEKKENIAYILQTAGYEVDCWLCVATLKKNYTTGLTDIIPLIFFNINFNTRLCFYFFFHSVLKADVIFLGMANSKRQSLMSRFFLLCNSAHNICRLLNSLTTDVETMTYVAPITLTRHLSSYLYQRWSVRTQSYSVGEKNIDFSVLISTIH